MSGFASPENLARLTAIGRQLKDAGAQAPISRPVEVEDGFVYGVVPGDSTDEVGTYLHVGVRLGWAPLPDRGGLLISIWGGLEPESGFEEEGVAAFMTADGLRRLAADLRAIADKCEVL